MNKDTRHKRTSRARQAAGDGIDSTRDPYKRQRGIAPESNADIWVSAWFKKHPEGPTTRKEAIELSAIIDAAVKASQLVPLRDVKAAASEYAGKVKNVLDALPSQFKQARPNATDDDMAALRDCIGALAKGL